MKINYSQRVVKLNMLMPVITFLKTGKHLYLELDDTFDQK